MEHTQGPWTARRDADARFTWSVWAGERPNHDVICHVNGGFEADVEAIARLIAAAPDLLAALEKMVNQPTWNRTLAPYERRDLDTARAAIARARGGGTA